MTPDQVKKYYKSGYALQRRTGISAASLGNWLKWGFIPENSQFKLEVLSDGKLKAEFKKRDDPSHSRETC
jgi:hypothetical protein